MVELSLQIGNENARAALRELKKFLAFATERMANPSSGYSRLEKRSDDATMAYVTVRTIYARLEQEIGRQDARQERASRPTPPKLRTIRDIRGR